MSQKQPQSSPALEVREPLETKASSGRWAWVGRFYAENRDALLGWVVWRFSLLVLPFFAGLLFPRLPGANYTSLDPFEPWRERLVSAWTTWDGGFYALIARDGYNRNDSLAFFPFFPHLERWLGYLIGFGNPTLDTYKLAGVIIAALASLALCLLIFRLARLEYDLETARLSLVFLLAFPTSFFLAAGYTESTFLALALGAFYAARTRRWLLALALASLTILTKNQGLFVPLALGIEYCQQIGWDWRKLDRRLWYFGLPVGSLAGWLGWNALAYNNPLTFQQATEQSFFRHLNWPWVTLINQVIYVFHREPNQATWDTFNQDRLDIAWLDLLFTAGFLALSLIGILLFRHGRLRSCYLVFFLFCLLQPLLNGNESSPLYSMSRYLVIIFPAYLILAVEGKRTPWLYYTYLAVNLPLLGLLVARFTLDYWTG